MMESNAGSVTRWIARLACTAPFAAALPVACGCETAGVRGEPSPPRGSAPRGKSRCGDCRGLGSVKYPNSGRMESCRYCDGAGLK